MKDFIQALLFSICFLYIVGSGAPSAQAQEYTLSWIHDGDTVTVKRGDKRVKVRLYGIDAPELDQAGGRASLHFLIGFKGAKGTPSDHKQRPPGAHCGHCFYR